MPVASVFGYLAIVWREVRGHPRIYQIFLPDKKTSVEEAVLRTFAGARPLSSPYVNELARKIKQFLSGEEVTFELSNMALERCSEFQKKVLLAEYKIPRGWVSTYGRIAASLKVPGGARAVGGALAGNPFPIIIPCHRAIRSDGSLGGFQGGLDMKKALLRLEGVKISPSGTLLDERIYY